MTTNMKSINLIFGLVLISCCSCLDLPKCSLYDSQCQKDFFQDIGRKLAFTGIPAVGIPVIDPFELKNVVLSILGLWNVTLIDGEAVGIQQCDVNKYESNVPKRYKEPDITCNKIVIKGNFKLTSAPIVQSEFTNIHGEGFAKITLENWHFNIKYPIKIVRESDGEIYVKGDFDKAVYKSDTTKVTLEASGLKMGILDITKPVVSFVNDHWKLIMASDIGKFINDHSMKLYYDTYSIFFDHVPAKEYYSDDLSSLVEKQDKLPSCDSKSKKSKNEL